MRRILLLVAASLVVAGGLCAADKSPVTFATIQELVKNKCSACHDWATSSKGILSLVTLGDPEKSLMYRRVSRDEMPPDQPLSADEKAVIRDWIAAGAPADSAAATETAAAPATPITGSFLGFPSKVAFHKTSGFTSGALFIGAGIAGAVQWGTLISAAHAYRDAHGIDEDTMSPACNDYIAGLRNDQLHTALRVTHVSLLSAGELLYVANAVTGLSMLTPNRPGLTPQELHRYAFFTHGTLMVSQLVLGMVTSSLLAQGNHWTMIGVGAAHTAIGLAIPAVMIGSGLLISRAFR